MVPRIISFLLSTMPNKLGCGDSADEPLGNMTAVVWALVTATPGILFLVDVEHIVVAIGVPIVIATAAVLALIVVAFFAATTTVDLLDLALVVIVFLPARLAPGNLSVFCDSLNELICRLFAADDDLLGGRLLENDGLRGLVADNDRLRRRLLRTEILGGSWVTFERVRIALDLALALHLTFHTVLSDGGRGRRALHFALDAVLADLAAGRGLALDLTLDLALDEAILSHIAVPVVVAVVDGVSAHLSALLDVLVVRTLAVHKAQFGLVAVFFEGPVRYLVALHCRVTAAAVGARLPVALPLPLSKYGRHGAQAGC
jgi:hypothetical protein